MVRQAGAYRYAAGAALVTAWLVGLVSCRRERPNPPLELVTLRPAQPVTTHAVGYVHPLGLDCGWWAWLSQRPTNDSAQIAGFVATPELLAVLNQSTMWTLDTTSFDPADPTWSVDRGKRLDSSVVQPYRIYHDSTGLTDHGLYVVGRIPIDSEWTGYVFRAPGFYGPTRIELWPLSRTMGWFSEPVCLGDVWGDAGDTQHIASWLLPPDSGGGRDLIQRWRISRQEMDEDTARDTTIVMRARWSAGRYIEVISIPDSSIRALPLLMTWP